MFGDSFMGLTRGLAILVGYVGLKGTIALKEGGGVSPNEILSPDIITQSTTGVSNTASEVIDSYTTLSVLRIKASRSGTNTEERGTE